MLQRLIFASDLHGDQQDKATVKALMEVTRDFKPKYRVFGGDLVDARPLRRGAGAEERAESMIDDWHKGMNFLKEWKPTHLHMGNHDKRLYDLAEADRGVESDFAWKGVNEMESLLGKLGTEWKPYNKKEVFRFGHLKTLHGFSHGVYAARQHAQIYGGCLFGHTHTIDEHSIPGLERRVARGAGCLCKLDMKWNAHMPSSMRHAHGFVMALLNEKTGNYWTVQCEEVDGTWVVPEKFKEVKTG